MGTMDQINPGEGYRLLGLHELLQEGDEYLCGNDNSTWRLVGDFEGETAGAPHWVSTTHRRKLSIAQEPQEAPPPVPGSPEDIESLSAMEATRPNTLQQDFQAMEDSMHGILSSMGLLNILPKPFIPNKYTRELLSLDGRKVPVDVYAVLSAFPSGSAAVDHAVKKLLAPGQRGAKTRLQDLKEARASLDRAIQMGGE